MNSAFLYDGIRTQFGRYGGALSGIRPDDLAAAVLRSLADRNDLDPATVDEIVFGAANQAGEDNRNVARMAALLADWPTSVPGPTVNRLCGSSMDAAMHAQYVSLDAAAEENGGELELGGHDDAFARAEAEATIHPMLSVLSPRERMIIDLRFEDGQSQSEIAEGLGLSQTQVSRLIRAALEKLSKRAGVAA